MHAQRPQLPPSAALILALQLHACAGSHAQAPTTQSQDNRPASATDSRLVRSPFAGSAEDYVRTHAEALILTADGLQREFHASFITLPTPTEVLILTDFVICRQCRSLCARMQRR